MNDTQQSTACTCTTCPGAACTCGCQQSSTPPATQATCACGPQCACGPACACGRS